MGKSSRSATRSTSPDDEFPMLASLGLKATDILGDGNCLFNALSDQIYGDQSHSRSIRSAVVEHMRDNADDYRAFVPVEPGLGFRRNPKRKNVASSATNMVPITRKQIEQNWENYLKRMAEDGTYGDNLEIRAFSQVYDTDVRIYHPANNFVSRVASDGVVRRTAHIALHTWEHYSSVRNINGPDYGLPNIHIDIERADLLASTPSTPGSSFTSSAASSVERDVDSDEEQAIYGPNKRALQPRHTNLSIIVTEAEIPSISLTDDEHKPIPKPVPRIILKLNTQARKESPQLRSRNVSAAQHKQLRKLEQKRAAKERKKEAAITSRPAPPPDASYQASPALRPVSGGMMTLTI